MPDPLPAFPVVYWTQWDAEATFLPGEELPGESQGRLWAVLVFVFYGDKLVLAEIEGRGMCVPSGRVEPGEAIAAAAEREAMEEAGVVIDPERLRLVGCYRLDQPDGARRYCPVFVAEALGLVDIPPGSESRGRFLASVEDVSDLYYTWDALMASVFAFADERRRDLFRPGISISKLLEG